MLSLHLKASKVFRNSYLSPIVPCLILFISVALCSCALIPQPQIGLEEFVHNLSRDMDCLQYCAERAQGKQGTDFVLKNPIDITLSVTNEGKISAAPNPTIFSMLGLELKGGEKRAGSLSLRLHVMEHCSKAGVFLKKGPGAEEGGKPVQFYNAVVFYDIINGTEYLYIQGNTDNNAASFSPDTQLMRFDLKKVDHVSCKRLYSIYRPECNCP